MPLDESILGSSVPFDPSEAVDNAINSLMGQSQGAPVDTAMATDRLARKILRPKPADVTPPESKASRAGKPDLSSLGVPADQELPQGPDLSSLGDPVEVPQAPAAPATPAQQPPLGVGGEAWAAAKGVPHGAVSATGDILKGGAALYDNGVPAQAETPQYDAMGNPTGMTSAPTAAIPAKPLQDRTLYKAGQATNDFAQSIAPMTDQEKDSIGGRVGTGLGTIAPYAAATIMGGPELGVAAGFTGMAASTYGQVYEAAKKAGKNDDDANRLALDSAGTAGILGSLPLGSGKLASSLVGKIAASGVTFATLGEAQEYVLQQIAKEYDPKAGYSPEAKRIIASLITGGVFGGLHAFEPKAEAAQDQTAAGLPPPADNTAAGATAPGGPDNGPRPDQSGVGADKMADILRHYGYSDADIAGMSHAQMRDTVMQEMRGASGAKPSGDAKADESAPPPKQGTEQAAKKQQASPADEDYSILRQGGYSDENIADMSQSQRDYEVNYYRNELGVDVADAVKRYPKPAEQPSATEATATETLKRRGYTDTDLATMSDADQRKAMIDNTPPTSAGTGDRTAPIKATTAEDVIRASEQVAEPTAPQAQAENYKHGHLDLDTLGLTGKNNISIETGPGQTRKGVDENGKEWSVQMPVAYGRIKGTKGADGQPLDIFIGPNPTSNHVFMVDQHHGGGKGFDEHKILAGFINPRAALKAYKDSYTDQGGDRIGGVTAISANEFKTWLKSGDHTAPFKEKPASSTHDEDAGSLALTEAPAGAGVPKATSPVGGSEEVTETPTPGRGTSSGIDGDILSPAKVYAEPLQAHHDQIEAVLGKDYDRVLPADAARAAEILSENEGMPPAVAFQHAVIENAVHGGYLTKQEAVDAYGKEVADILEPVSEGTSGGSGHAVQESPEPRQERAGDAEEGGELSGGGKAGGDDTNAGAVDHQPDTERGTTDESNTSGETKPSRRKSETAAVEETEVKTRIEDAGEKIGGARKDAWIGRGLSFDDLADMTGAERDKHVNKHNIWQKPDYVQAVADGVEPKAAALIKRIYDQIAVKPTLERYGVQESLQKNYIAALNAVREAVEAIKTEKDVRGLNDKVSGILGRNKDVDSWDAMSSLRKAGTRVSPLYISGRDIRWAERAVAEGFPQAEPWTRLFQVIKRNVYNYTEANKAHMVSGEAWSLYRKNGGRISQHDTQEAAEAAAKAAYEAMPDERKKGGEEPKRPHLDSVEREGPDYRKSKDVGSEDFIKDFGFRGVEFGNWVAGDERQKVVNLAYDALHDLARTLNLPPKAMSLDGTLAVAFGARGIGGRAAAHYEADRTVINMTKLSGAGSLAHEWAHALDHYLGESASKTPYASKVQSVSGWRDTPPSVEDHYRSNDFLSANHLLPQKLRAAANRLMHTLFNAEEADDAHETRAAKEIETAKSHQQGWVKAIERIKERMKTGGSRTGLKQAEDQVGIWARSIARMEANRDKGRKKAVPSRFRAEATKLSGTTGDYWRRPNELLARSFESYVFDKIEAEGFKSQYLVQGVEPDRYGVGFKGNPYPTGEERAAINEAYDRLFRALATTEGKHGPDTRLRGADGEPEPVVTVTKVKKQESQPTAKQEAAAVDQASRMLTDALERRFSNNEGFPNILQARKFAKDNGFGDDPKVIEEAIEAAVVRTARGDIATTKSDKTAYQALVNLYARQPKLGTRTSTSMREQAYSTPVPLAFVAAKLAGINDKTTVYEPTAGNGALLITADPKNVFANEINPDRAAELKGQGFNVSTINAAKEPTISGMDRVIANPPFGPVVENGQSKVFDMSSIQPGYKTTNIDHAIALHALDAMKDDGKAVLIVGGINKMAQSEAARSDAYNEKAKREFYKVLYDNYGVVDHFTVAGELYERQGAGWPVDVIQIEGRKPSSRALPAVDVPRIYSSWDALGGLLDGIRPESAGDARPTIGPAGGALETGDAGLEGAGRSGGVGAGSEQPGLGQPGGIRGKLTTATAETGEGGAGTPVQSGERQRPARSGEQPAAERPSSGLTDDLDSILNDALDAAYGPKETNSTGERSNGRGGSVDSRTTPEVAKSAAKNAVEGADAAFDALHKLFGGTKASAGFTFDDETYAKAKPLFEQAAGKFRDVWGDIRELAKRMVAHMRDTLKWSREAMQQALPYLKRFMEDFRGEKGQEAKTEAPRERTTSKGEETENQVAYTPQSKTPGLDTLVPVNMRRSIADALDDLESRVGPVDDFVAKELGYKGDELEKYFGAEQIDALGLAIDNLKRNKGFIIGDQTGIGKGRVNAGIIRWAYQNDRIPIFVTEKPGLYADMYRDMADIGMNDMFDNGPRILATNPGLKLALDDAGTVKIANGDPKSHNDVMRKATDDFFQHHDMVFTNYSQMQTVKGEDTARRQFLQGIAPRAVIIMDESHNAGGQANTRAAKGTPMDRAGFARNLVQKSKGVFYSSATYAKRPDVMDLYAATDMAMAVDDLSHLAEAIQRGGVPMQQVVATMLADAGQYIRRERSFKGINYNTPIIPVDRGTYDQMSKALAQIQDLSSHVAAATSLISKKLKAEAGALSSDNATGDAGAHSTAFTSIMHNVINQMLLAMKVQPAADRAIDAIRRGEKPVLTVANTMESFLSDFAETTGVSPGEEIPADFGDVLHKYLDRTRTIIIRKPFAKAGETIRHYLTDEELGAHGLGVYNGAKATIAGMDLSKLPVSPIDHLKSELQKAGYNVGEITGRGLVVDYSGPVPVLRARPGSETSTAGRNKARAAFNKKPENGGLHAIIINQAGSTGISMHSSSRFDDQSKRRMFIVQPEGNIDTHMQLLGRVNRTGQTVLPEYDQLVADIPAEKRPASVLAKKMASLNANTTASRSSALTSKDVPDFLNEYGDSIAVGYLLDNMEVNARLAFPVKVSDGGKLTGEDAMRRLTGRIPLLPLAEQEAVYSHLESEYTSLIQQLEAAGENALEAKTVDLKAKVLERAEVQEKRNNSGSPFAAPVTMEKASIIRPGKPYKPAELMNMISRQLRGNDDLDAFSKMDMLTLADMLHNVNTPYAAWGKEAAVIERGTRANAVKEFDDYTRPILDNIEDAEKRAKEITKFNEVKDRFNTVHQLVPIGRRVTLKTVSGNLPGVVVDVERTGDAKNPLALGSWKATFAIPDSTKSMTLPFSRIVEDGKANPDSILDVEVVPTQNHVEGVQQTLERFANKQTEARETRYIATGNMLAAYDWLDRKGQIINYTDDRGAIRQGILTSRDFDLNKHAVHKGKLLQEPKEIKAWLDANSSLKIDGGSVTIQRESQWSDRYDITTDKSKRNGGRFYLDKDLTDLTGDFYSRNNMMQTTVDGKKIEKVIKRLQQLGGRFKVPAMAPKVEKVPERPEEPLASAADAHLPMTSQALAHRSDIERAVTAAVRHLVGNHVTIDFTDGLMPFELGSEKRWGDLGKQSAGAKGMYYPWRALIRLAMLRGVDETAYHEAYHAIEYQLQTPAERALMERETDHLRDYVLKKEPRFTPDMVNGLAPEEVRAIAFQKYAKQRADDKAAGDGLHIGIRRFFERLWDAVRSLGNALKGYGFQTYRDIFEKAVEGGYANAPGDTPRPEAVPLAMAAHGPESLDTIINTRVAGKLNATEARVQLQDRMIRVKKAETSVGETRSSHSPYQAENLYYGRTGERLETLDKEQIDPLVKEIKDQGLSVGEVNDYLYARHAEERNDRIGVMHKPGTQFNDAVYDHDVVGASGMSTNDAREIINRVRAAGQGPAYDAVEKRVRDIINRTRQTLLNTGLLSQESADDWARQYSNYVPLRGFAEGAEDDHAAMRGLGGGMNTRGKEAKAAFGRESTADGPLNYIIHQAMSAIVRGEKNRVGNTMLRFVQDNPDTERWTVNKPQFTHTLDKNTGLITAVPDNFSDYTDPRVFMTKVGGKPYRIRFEGPDGVNIARAMNNMGTAQLHSVVRTLGAATRFLARINTSWNPEFFASNFARDLGEAFINMQESEQRGFVKSFRKHIAGAMLGSMQALAGKNPNGHYVKAFHEFDKAGGRIRFFGLESPEDIAADVERKMKRMEGGALNTIKDAGHALGTGMEIINGGFENATRLATYMAARDVGRSQADAAAMAQNITVNFTRKGELGSAISAFYMFANASLQGTARMATALRHKRVRRAVYMLAAASAASALYNMFAGGDDDDGTSFFEKIEPWVRDKNYILMWPKGFGKDGRYLKIPTPYGYGPFKVLGDHAAAVLAGKESVTKAASAFLGSIADAFDPLGGDENRIAEFAPSLLRPTVHLETNKNWTGKPMYPDHDYDKALPDSQKSFKSNSQFAKSTAQGLNSATGGNAYKPGAIDIHPATVDEYLSTLTGGLGRFVKGVVSTVVSGVSDGEWDATKTPVLRRYIGQAGGAQSDQAAYYEARQPFMDSKEQVSRARGDMKSSVNVDESRKFIEENNSNPESSIFRQADNQLKNLRKRAARIATDSELSDKQTQTKEVQDQMRAVMNSARQRLRERKQGQGNEQPGQ